MALDPSSFFSGIDIKAILGNIFNIVLLIVLVLVAAGFVYMILRWKKQKGSEATKEIKWWEEVSGQLVPIRSDKAQEISIPGTNLKVFFVKDKNMWLPRFSRGITTNLYYVALTKNKELINFTLKSIDDELAKSNLSYDHTDMRWAAENLREFVKRNYKDKAVTWWKEYSQVIGVAIFVTFMTISLVTIIYFMRGIVEDIGAVANTLNVALDKMNACRPPPTSGVIGAT